MATSSQQDARMFAREGVDLVLVPYADAAREAAARLMPAATLHSRASKVEGYHEAFQ